MIAQIDKNYITTRPFKLYSRFLSYLFFEGRPVTTRGRWINPLVYANYHIGKTIPKIKKVEKPIFILGTGRSGTTILGIVLSMHKHVAFLNEPKAFWNFLYPYEDLIGSYSNNNEASYRLAQNAATKEMIETAHRVYGYYLGLSFSRRVVDKYPELIFRTEFVKKIFPDAKFIFLVRNGWDTCASINSWSQRLGVTANNEIQDWWGVNRRKWQLMVEQLVAFDAELLENIYEIRRFEKHTDMAAVEWILTMKQGLQLIKEGNSNILMIKYEDMVTNTNEVMSNLSNFCELKQDDKFLRYAQEVLKPASAKGPIDLHPAITDHFKKVMLKLNYENV